MLDTPSGLTDRDACAKIFFITEEEALLPLFLLI